MLVSFYIREKTELRKVTESEFNKEMAYYDDFDFDLIKFIDVKYNVGIYNLQMEFQITINSYVMDEIIERMV